jgi:hypothetical protein
MQCWGLQEQLKQGVHCLTWPTPPAEEESLVLLLCDWPPDERVTQTGWPVDQLVVDFPASHTAQRQGQGLGCCCWGRDSCFKLACRKITGNGPDTVTGLSTILL